MRSMQLAEAESRCSSAPQSPAGPGPAEVLVRVRACGVCRTDLHIVDDDLPCLDHPIVPATRSSAWSPEAGPGAEHFGPGTRVGVPWLGLDLRDMPLLPERP